MGPKSLLSWQRGVVSTQAASQEAGLDLGYGKSPLSPGRRGVRPLVVGVIATLSPSTEVSSQ